MKLLLHVCCGPCSLYPANVLHEEGISFSAYFYNPNIHPYKEFKKRIHALELVAKLLRFDLILDRNYGLTDYLRKVVFNENKRCHICYELRLSKCIEFAANNGFDAFSTTLLYSKYQNHKLIYDICFQLTDKFGIEFFYKDFREGWQKGIDQSKDLDIYRQRYCGCIFSEHEAFDKNFRKKMKLQTPGNY